MEDLKQSNLILAESPEADPWLSLIDRQMDFVLHDGTASRSNSPLQSKGDAIMICLRNATRQLYLDTIQDL
jgi:hypothetical protein